MAVVNLRPIGDITLEHKCSSGSNGYTLINEVTCDNDGTYISRFYFDFYKDCNFILSLRRFS